jgi:cell division protein FtsB
LIPRLFKSNIIYIRHVYRKIISPSGTKSNNKSIWDLCVKKNILLVLIMDRFIYKEKKVRNRGRRSVSSSSLFNNVVTKVVLLVISVFLLYNVGHSASITIQKLDILQKARVEVDELRLKNLELALLLDNIQGVEYLEIQARNRLKLAGEQEYIFVIPEGVLEGVDNDFKKLLKKGGGVEKRAVYEIWREFLLKGAGIFE